MNVNPQEVAKELWKLIEARLNNGTGHPTNSWNTIKDLEKVVTPLVLGNRRSLTQPTAYHVASELDRITRRAIARDSPEIGLMDEEIMTRNIVADMMVSLKTVQSRSEEANKPSKRMYDSNVMTNNDEQDDYVNVKIRRQDILRAFD